MSDRNPRSATDENLIRHALAPMFRWLIATALDGSVLTYGEIKHELENEAGFSTVFATRVGFTAGRLMETIQKRAHDAPLINVLVVNQKDRQPSEGAGSFMAIRFNDRRLAETGAKERYPELWESSFRRAAAEVYAYSEKKWSALYKKVFDDDLSLRRISDVRDDRKRGAENDGIQTGRKIGAGGEAAPHRALRLWIKDNPHKVNAGFAGAEADTEVDLDSGDRVDVVYKCADRIVLLEVKSRTSNEIDLKRGVYQCIKYRAVRAAMDVRENPLIETYLVTETSPPGHIRTLLRQHQIKHFLAPVNR